MDSILLGALAAWLAADALGWMTQGDATSPGDNPAERSLAAWWRASLRSWTQPLASWLERSAPRTIARLAQEQGIFLTSGVTASELLASWMVHGILLASGIAWLLILAGNHAVTSLLFWMLIAGAAAVALQVWQFRFRSRRQRQQLLAQLPTGLELLALIVEAGANDLTSAWSTVEREYRGQVLGQHFRYVLAEVSRGQSFRNALQSWSDLSRERETSEVALLIKTAYDRGTPIQESLKNLAIQARLRRMQRLEEAAAAAKIHMVWPGFLMMLASLLVACAPLGLSSTEVIFSVFGW